MRINNLCQIILLAWYTKPYEHSTITGCGNSKMLNFTTHYIPLFYSWNFVGIPQGLIRQHPPSHAYQPGSAVQ